MAFARVVSFEGVTKERIAELQREMAEGERPEGLPATELIVLHDPESRSPSRSSSSRQRTTTGRATKH